MTFNELADQALTSMIQRSAALKLAIQELMRRYPHAAQSPLAWQDAMDQELGKRRNPNLDKLDIALEWGQASDEGRLHAGMDKVHGLRVAVTA